MRFPYLCYSQMCAKDNSSVENPAQLHDCVGPTERQTTNSENFSSEFNLPYSGRSSFISSPTRTTGLQNHQTALTEVGDCARHHHALLEKQYPQTVQSAYHQVAGILL